MSDNPKHLFEAAFDCKTAEAFKAELERATDVQVNFRDGNGSTVLNWMCFNHDWPEAAAALIKRGCDVNAKDNDGFTPLHQAGQFSRRELASVLIEHGAKQIDQWVKQYKDHAEFGYIFRENARDVLNKQNPESVKKTLAYLASLVV